MADRTLENSSYEMKMARGFVTPLDLITSLSTTYHGRREYRNRLSELALNRGNWKNTQTARNVKINLCTYGFAPSPIRDLNTKKGGEIEEHAHINHTEGCE